MWIFTKEGFFSAVEYTGKAKGFEPGELVLVRARFKKDLVRLSEKLQCPFGRVKTTFSADYPFRMLVAKKAWANYVGRAAEGIDYPNFKGEVLQDASRDRSERYHNVWLSMSGYLY